MFSDTERAVYIVSEREDIGVIGTDRIGGRL